MESQKLFQEFDAVSSKEWKQKIQFELKGADYNDTLLWESLEGIKVKPFYHKDEFENTVSVDTKVSQFKIVQNIFVHDVAKSNKKAADTLNRGANSIRFTLENEAVSIPDLMQNLPLENTTYFFYLPFLANDFVNQIHEFATKNKAQITIQIDPIGQLIKEGNWFENLEKDFHTLNTIATKVTIPFLNIKSGIVRMK